jgi:hypothetical protein
MPPHSLFSFPSHTRSVPFDRCHKEEIASNKPWHPINDRMDTNFYSDDEEGRAEEDEDEDEDEDEEGGEEGEERGDEKTEEEEGFLETTALRRWSWKVQLSKMDFWRGLREVSWRRRRAVARRSATSSSEREEK